MQPRITLASSVAELLDIEEFPASAPPPPEPSSSASDEAWPEIDPAAYHGLAGEFVRALEPHTEADPVGILLQFLAAFGNIVGNSPYYLVESSRHRGNLFAALVGKSSRSRKGTGADRVRAISEAADATWASDRNGSGLSSGEGLIDKVRDQIMKWNAKEQGNEIVDPGVTDKRLMVIEPEFASALAAMDRHGNKLSAIIRNAWDGGRLQTMTVGNPLKATGAHISIIGHITKDELRARLTRTDMANGFANRFLFALVRRSKLLPHGGHFPEAELQRFSERLCQAIEFAKMVGRVTMTDEAARAWEAAYVELSADRPGLLGAVTARAEAQVIRLALVYALLDGVDQIDVVHLNAAAAVWAYCEQSATNIFGESLGDPVADDILRALHARPNGMNRTEISQLFGRHRTSDQIGAALAMLLKLGRVKFETKQTGGRPVETWLVIGGSR